jgi:hypothetical protein
MMREFGDNFRPEKRSGWSKWSLYGGLGIALAPLALCLAFVIYAAAVLLYAFLWVAPNDDGSSYIPANLHGKLIYRDGGGFVGPGGGCMYVLYSIPPDIRKSIEQSGTTFFVQTPQPKFATESGNLYGQWQMTPAPPRPPLLLNGKTTRDISYARNLQAHGCNNDDWKKIQALVGDDPLEIRGNYYAISQNKEGMIVVVPSRDLVIYAYSG